MFPSAKEIKYNLEVELELKKFDQLLNKLAILLATIEIDFNHLPSFYYDHPTTTRTTCSAV